MIESVQQETTAVRARKVARRIFRNENAVLIVVLIALLGGFSVVTGGRSINPENLRNILIQSSIRGVTSVGQAYVVLTAGIDVSVGGIGLMCALLGSTLMTENLLDNLVGFSVAPYIAVPVMVLVGAGWGLINGLSVSRISMPPLIVTLAMWQITRGAAFSVSGGQIIRNLPDPMAFFGRGTVTGVPVPVIIFIVVAVTGYLILMHTTYGKSVYAVGGNPVGAWLCGINTKNILLSVYIISGFLAGVSGVIVTGRLMATSMRTLLGLELDSIASIAVGGISLMGGRGSLIGVVIGVLIIGLVNNAMSILGANPAVQGIVKGAIIFAAVAVDYLRRR